MKLEPDELDETVVALDPYNCDLNLVLGASRYAAHPLTHEGFAFMWAGVRATHGFAKGKVCYEVKIVENLDVSHLPEDEPNPHVVRVGFSVEGSTLQLGEDPLSYGYGGTGKISTNCQFRDFGGPFAAGDVILAILNMDTDPVQIGFAKNGRFLGWAYRVNKQELKGQALFPHILTKNISFEVNFGQKDKPYFALPEAARDFMFVNCTPGDQRIGGTRAPKKQECEIIMMCGLPGAGKSVWAADYSIKHPEKKYNILGTNNIIDKMKVMGLPRKRNYHGRWDVLIKMATNCLNKMFEIGSKLRRNYILDQTNVYPTAQRRKMRNFDGFKRLAVVVVPTDAEWKKRCDKRDREEGKEIPDSAVNEMKANFKIPEKNDVFDEVMFTECQREEAEKLVRMYNEEGRAATGPPRKQFRPNEPSGFGNRGFDSNRGDFNQGSPGRGGFGGQGGFGNNSPGRDSPGRFGEGRGSYGGNRDDFDGNRGGRDSPGGYGGNRGGFSGNRGGRGGFDNGRGGRGGFDNGRGGFDNRRGGRGGFDNGRGSRGGFDNGRGSRGGFDNGRGGYDGNRGGFRGNRGSYDNMRNDFKESKGGYDGGRGGFDGGRGGYGGDREGYDGGRGGYNSGRGGFDGGRGGYDRKRVFNDYGDDNGGPRGFDKRGGYHSNRGGYDESRGIKRGYEDGLFDHSPSGGGSPASYGDNSQGSYGGDSSSYGSSRGFGSSRGGRGRGDFGSRSFDYQGGSSYPSNAPSDQYSGRFNQSDDSGSYDNKGSSFGGGPRGRGGRGGPRDGQSRGGNPRGGYGGSNRGGYGDYQSEYSSQTQGGYGSGSDAYNKRDAGYSSAPQGGFKTEPGVQSYDSGSRPSQGTTRASGRASRWSAAEPAQQTQSYQSPAAEDSSYPTYGAPVKAEPASSAGYDSYTGQASGYSSYGQSTAASGYSSGTAPAQSYNYQQSTAATQQWSTPQTAAASTPAATDQSQWSQYYQQPASQPNQYYSQYYGQSAGGSNPGY